MEQTPNLRSYLAAIIVSLVLFVGVFFSYRSAKNRTSTIVLPGGITYLGPTAQPTTYNLQPTTSGVITVPSDVKWVSYQGKKFPYSFSYPETLSLGVFPNDPYDSVTIFIEGTDPGHNLFLRVEDLNKLGKQEYLGKPMEYAQNWWKNYTAWKGVESVTRFTNSQGMVGYRAKYLNDKGETPYDHLFFEVPNRPELVIWMAPSLLPASVFDRLADSLTWQP